MKTARIVRKSKWILIGVVFVPALLAVAANLWIVIATEDLMYRDPEIVPPHEVGLVLGTSKHLAGGGESLDFRQRIEAASMLYHAGKIKRILASGTGVSGDYDETATMKDELMMRGIPEPAIMLDPAGFRTLDSMVRAKRVFGLHRFTIISQEYHTPRALFIGKHYGLDVVAFCAEEVPREKRRKTTIREFFARIKAVIDLYLAPPTSTVPPPGEIQNPM